MLYKPFFGDDCQGVLARFRDNIFHQPYVSSGKDSSGMFSPCYRTSKNIALDEYALIQVNGPKRLAYIPVDIDHSDAAYAWRDNGKPEPNIIVTSIESGHSHLVYELEKPVWKEAATEWGDALPVRYYRAVRQALTKELHGDPSYNGLLVKNPFFTGWQTQIVRQEPYTLGELAENLDLSKMPHAALREDGRGRNCTLFDSIRIWAMTAVRGFTTIGAFRGAMLDKLERLNQEFYEPLPYSELRSTLKSVSTYTEIRNIPLAIHGRVIVHRSMVRN